MDTTVGTHHPPPPPPLKLSVGMRSGGFNTKDVFVHVLPGKNTQVESGLGTSTVSIVQYSDPYVIKISVVYGTLKHYLFFRYGNNNVYIFTNKADTSVTVQRYIVRFPAGIFSHSTVDSDYEADSTTVIEAQDINEDTSTGYTFSKHYSGYLYGRFVNLFVCSLHERIVLLTPRRTR